MMKYIFFIILCLFYYDVKSQQHYANKLDSLMIQHLLVQKEFHSIDISNYNNLLGYMFSRKVYSCASQNSFTVMKFGASASHSNIYLAIFQNDSLVILPEKDISKCWLIIKQRISAAKCRVSSKAIISLVDDIIFVHTYNGKVWITEEEK